MAQTFLFYDLETWSLSPPHTSIVEAAWQRTDATFTPVDEPGHLVCKPLPEAVPQPEALLVHGKTPQWAERCGVDEYEFARQLHAECNKPNTCVIGFNNLRYDDECLRYLFYRNLLDPYTHQYKNGNSRWDVLDLVRFTYALRPSLLDWPTQTDTPNTVSLKLEDLARANGLFGDGTAHDAAHDTAMTIALARQLYCANPRMVEFAYAQTRSAHLGELANQFLGKLCLHISPRIPRSQGHMSLVYLVCRNPSNPKQVYAVDVSAPVDMLLLEPADAIREVLFTPHKELNMDCSVPRIKKVHLNRAAVLLEPRILTDERAQSLGIDKQQCQARYQQLVAEPSLGNKLIALFGDDSSEGAAYTNVEHDANYTLYNAFIPNADRRQADIIHNQPRELWVDINPQWEDARMDYLWLRLRGRLMPQSLSSMEREIWENYKRASLQGAISNKALGLAATLARIDSLLEEHPGHSSLLDLQHYLRHKQLIELKK